MKHYFLNAVQCAIEHESKFLIIKRPEGIHAGGALSFPGGKVEEIDGQNDADILKAAAKREVLEEVGIDLKDPLTYKLSNYFLRINEIHGINTVFHCKIEKTDLTVTPSAREVDEYYWLTEKEINNAKNAPEWLKMYVACIQRN